MNINENQSQQELLEFREKIYEGFPCTGDALMNLVDALSSNEGVNSPPELSENEQFERGHDSIYKGIAGCAKKIEEDKLELEGKVAGYIEPYLPKPKSRKFYLLGVDGTPLPSPYAKTAEDRSYIYRPNPAPGVKPVTIGHAASSVVLLPEKEEGEPAWVVPLRMERIPTELGEKQVGLNQLGELLTDKKLPFHNELTVTVVDSKYGQIPFLHPMWDYKNHVVISRLRCDRVLYRQAEERDESTPNPKGRPPEYGERFAFKNEETWGESEHRDRHDWSSVRGKKYQTHLRRWDNLLMLSEDGMRMSDKPFSVIRVEVFKEDGTPLYKRPMWLIVYGQRRDDISLLESYFAYKQRFDHEHYFRFSKRNLLLDKYQSPDIAKLDVWLFLNQLAYLQLWLARHLACPSPKPWQRYLPQPTLGLSATPTHTQRDFGRIIRHFGTPANESKRRGKSPGRAKGTQMTKRKRRKFKKSAKKPKKKPKEKPTKSSK